MHARSSLAATARLVSRLRVPRAARLAPLCLALFAGTALTGTAGADGTVAKVFVFNGGADNEGKSGDVFASAAQGWIFDGLGLLDASGKPPTLSGDDLKQGTTTVGKVLRDGNNKIVGYESANGKARAYNVDTSATTLDAWNALGASGEFVVAKHGEDGGGGITLDGGTMYDGFEQTGSTGGGTGQGNPAGPYSLPAKPGGNITFDANGCYTAADPAGGGTKVTDSAAGIGGVTGTSGNTRIVYKSTRIGLGGTPKQRHDALAKLGEAARKAGFKDDDGAGDPATWIASLPFPDQHSTVEATIAGTGATFGLSYAKDTSCSVGSGGGCAYTPLKVFGSSGGSLLFQVEPGWPSLQLDVPPPALPGLDPVQLSPTVADVSLPPGQEPATYFARVHKYGLDPSLGLLFPLQLTMSFEPGLPIVGVFEVQGGALLPVTASVDPVLGLVQVQVTHSGTFVALTEATTGSGYCFCDAALAPCSNPGDPGEGCENSTGVGARIHATGSASVAAQGTDPLVLHVSQARPNKTYVWVQGAGAPFFAPFRDGVLCVGNPTLRLPGFGCGGVQVGTLDGSGSISTDDPTYGFDIVAAVLCNGEDLAAQAPAVRDYQMWYRDGMGPCGFGSNLTNAVSVSWVP